MIGYWNQANLRLTTSTTTIDGWRQLKNHRWADTSLRRVSATYTMASTWAPEPSFTMLPSPIAGAGARWRRFLSRVSLMDVPYGSDPQGPMPCRAKKSFAGRDLDWGKTTIAC